MAERKPVWLETWTVVEGPGFPRVESWPDVGYIAIFDGYQHCDEEGRTTRATIAAAAPALVRALLLAEVGVHTVAVGDENGEGDPECGVCSEAAAWGRQPDPHANGCALDAALTAAGFPDRASRDAARKLMKESKHG